MSIAIIAAVTDNLAIGRKGSLLYHLPADLRRFKELTMGHPIIMGRKTYESLPKGPLPGRRNIVVTRTPAEFLERAGEHAASLEAVGSLEEAIALTRGEDAFVIGGAQIYQQAMPAADTLYITRIFAQAPDADTFFPPLDGWRIDEAGEIETDPAAGLSYQYQRLKPLKK